MTSRGSWVLAVMWRGWLLLAVTLAGPLTAQEVEGVKVVRSVKFQGNHSIDEKMLRASLSTQQAPLFYRLSLTRWLGLAKPTVFDAMEFRRDVLRLQALYGVHGFPEAKVDTTVRRKGDDLDITFHIAENRPIVVDSVVIVGLDTLEHLPDIRKLLPLQAGNPFDRIAFQTSVSVLEALLRDRGHAFAHVTGGFAASKEDPPRSVTITLTADPGPRARIGAVEVAGTEAIDKRVVLKTLMIQPGQIYSDSALHAGMMNLQRTELFRQVRLGLVDTAPSSDQDTLVTVRVRARLAEYPLRRARVSAGYGTLDCLRAMGSVDLFNFSGQGRRLEVSYSLSYGRTLATAATFCALLNVCSLDDQTIFGARRRRSVVSFQLVHDGSNSINDPTDGSTIVTELRVSPSFLGSDRFMRFARLTGGYTSHHQLGGSPGRVFSWRLRAGTVVAPDVSLPSGSRAYVPVEERLFAGGSTTVRGFPENQLGPVVRVINANNSIRTSATGGTFMAVGNAEARFPLRLIGVQLFGALFVDAGMATERRDMALNQVRITPGAGLRMPSLLGPIRLDVGFNPYAAEAGPLYRQTTTDLVLVDPAFRPHLKLIDRFQLHLSIGQAF